MPVYQRNQRVVHGMKTYTSVSRLIGDKGAHKPLFSVSEIDKRRGQMSELERQGYTFEMKPESWRVFWHGEHIGGNGRIPGMAWKSNLSDMMTQAVICAFAHRKKNRKNDKISY